MPLPPIGLRAQRLGSHTTVVDGARPPPPDFSKVFEQDRFESPRGFDPREVMLNHAGTTRPPKDVLLDEALGTAVGRLNGFEERNPTGASEGPRVGGEKGRVDVQGEFRTRTTGAVEREGDQDVYRQGHETKTVAGGKLNGRRTGAGHELEGTHSVDVELRVPAGSKRELLPTTWRALNDPRSMPDGSELRIKGTTTRKSASGVEVPVGRGGVGIDSSLERGTSSELRVRRTGDTVEVTRIDDDKRVSQRRAGVSVGDKKLGGLTSVDAKAGGELQTSERTEKTVRFDLSTTEGRDAYERFVATRELPAQSGPGVETAAEKRVRRMERAAIGSLEGHTPAKGHKLEGKSGSDVTEETVTRGADGKEEAVLRATTPIGSEVTGVTKDGRTHYEVKVPKPDANTVKLLERAFPGQVQRDADGSLTVKFTEAQFQQLSDKMYPAWKDTPSPPARWFAQLVARMPPGEFAHEAFKATNRRR